DSYATDGRQLGLAKELLESVRNGIVRDDFLSCSRPIDADVATASLEISTREGLTHWIRIAEVQSNEIRAIRDQEVATGNLLGTEEDIDHDRFASDTVCIGGTGGKSVHTPCDPDRRVGMDLDLAQKQSGSL